MIAAYADWLARKNSEALSYIPRPKLEEYAERGQIMVQYENDEPCGSLVHGTATRGVLRVYQACVQFDARRIHHGLALVERLKREALRRGAHAISLRCAADLEANAFWLAAGFRLVGQVAGGARRGRVINEYRLDVGRTLFEANR